jgi:two-component system chemotaxis sensor kinase CheA
VRYNPAETFLLEAEELLAQIEESALSLGTGTQTEETVNTLFRAFHTIKGSGSMCGFEAVAAFTHHVESLLDQVREGVIPASPKLIELVLKAKDHIKSLLNGEQSGVPIEPGSSETLIAAIGEFLHAGLPASNRETLDPVQVAPDQLDEQQPEVEEAWLIRFRPNPDLLTSGGNPVALLRELRTLGSGDIKASTEEVPALDSLQPDLCYLQWTITLRTASDENAIRDVFVFVEDGAALEVERIERPPQDLRRPPSNRFHGTQLPRPSFPRRYSPERAPCGCRRKGLTTL